MNRQDLIKQYKEYGLSQEEIAEELGLDPFYVKSALLVPEKKTTEVRSMYLYGDRPGYYKGHGTDKTRTHLELIYKHGPLKLNNIIKRMGFRLGAEFLGVTMNDIISLKYAFGYYNPLPGNALEIMTYFSEELRREVDKRDNHVCARCNRTIEQGKVRYHKISQPGPMVIDNCVTLCVYCRNNRILRHYDIDPTRFDGMTHDDFVKWIQENDKFVVRNRIYPKGKRLGT